MTQYSRSRRLAAWLALSALLLFAMASLPRIAAPQEGGPSAAPLPAAGETTGASDGDASNTQTAPAAVPARPAAGEGISLFSLFWSAGWWLLPMAVMMILVATVTIERALALRGSRVIPVDLIEGLGQLGNRPGGFDPRQAYKLCQLYPSAASTVIRAMLLKVGRPHGEVEHAVSETSEREAERMYSNVRWLTLTAAVAPLYGLTGTVWGMIVAFRQTTILQAGQNKAEFLAEGIYTALVTTLGGLLIAIPAAILAHWFEGRIQTLFHRIDELLFNLLPQVERYEGRVRFGRQVGEGEGPPPPPTPDEPPVEAEPVASTRK